MSYTEEKGTSLCPKMTVSLCDKTVRTESVGDYVLPDYQPEIRRVLCVLPTVLPPAKYVGNGSVEWNGTVDYQVFYVGGDGELYSLSLSSEYGGNVPLDAVDGLDLNEGLSVLVGTVSEGATTRVSGPRRLNVRCRLCSKIRAYGSIPLEVQEMGVENGAALQRRQAEGMTMRAWSGCADEVLCKEELPGMEETRVVSATAEAFVESTRREPGGLRALGTVVLHLILKREGEPAECLIRRIPLEGWIEGEHLSTECSLRGTVGEIRIESDQGTIHCEVEVLLEGRCLENQPIAYVDDAYGLDREEICRYAKYTVPRALACLSGNFSQSERVPLAEIGFPEGATLLDTLGTLSLEECRWSDGKLVFLGKSHYLFLCEKDGEFFGVEADLPVRYETEGSDREPVSFDAAATAMSCRARAEGDILSLDAEWLVSADLVGSEEITALTEVSLDKPIESANCCMRVYYPSAEETAWSVAKKYHVPPERIERAENYYFF